MKVDDLWLVSCVALYHQVCVCVDMSMLYAIESDWLDWSFISMSIKKSKLQHGNYWMAYIGVCSTLELSFPLTHLLYIAIFLYIYIIRKRTTANLLIKHFLFPEWCLIHFNDDSLNCATENAYCGICLVDGLLNIEWTFMWRDFTSKY